jgi:hypothetical protein
MNLRQTISANVYGGIVGNDAGLNEFLKERREVQQQESDDHH